MRKIDLHGVKHAEVQRLLDVLFWDVMNTTAQSCVVVTGNSVKMKSIVSEIAKEYGFDVIQDPTNDGSVIVQM